MKCCSPWGDLFLICPHKSVWTGSRGLLEVPFLALNWTLGCLPNWHYFFSGGEMMGKSWISFILLDLYNWENMRWPNLLWRSQLSSNLLKKQCSLSPSRIYTLPIVLVPLIMILLVSKFLTTQFFDLKMTSCPCSHVWLTLKKLCFSPSTNNAFSSLTFSSKNIDYFPLMVVGELLPKVTFFSFLISFNEMNLSLSPVICFKHPL